MVTTNYLKRWNLTILTEQRKTLRCQKDIIIHGTKIHKELENCIVLCSNCHRKKTTEEKDYLETDYVEPEELQYDLFGLIYLEADGLDPTTIWCVVTRENGVRYRTYHSRQPL